MKSSTELLDKAVSAATWGYAGTLVKLLLQIGVQIILARILGPHHYGLFAISVMIASFLMFFTDICSSALIPREHLLQEDVNFAFTWQLIFSVVSTCILYFAADYVSIFFKETELATVLKTLSIICLFNGIGGVSLALLRRKINFKLIQISQIIGYLIGYVFVALPFAYFVERSAIALVLAWLTQSLITSALYIYFASERFKLSFKSQNSKDILSFGFHSLISNISTWGLFNIDKFIIAKCFNSLSVGLYATSSNLLFTPLAQILSTLQQLVFSITANLSVNNATKVFSSLIATVLFFLGVAYLFTFVFAKSIILILYGPNWVGAIPFIKAFSVTYFFYAVAGVITPLLWAQGAVKKDSKIQFSIACLIGLGAIYFSTISAIAVAWWVAFVYGIRTIFLLMAGIKIFADAKAELFDTSKRFTALMIATATIFIFINYLLDFYKVNLHIGFILALMLIPIYLIVILKNRKLMGTAFAVVMDEMIFKFTKILHKVK
jgi:lipopolysaccharide exporter